MTEYLLTIFQPEGPPPVFQPGGPPPAELDLDGMTAQLDALNQELRDAGAFVYTGGLHPPATATGLRVRGGGLPMTHGPRAETKEHVGGFTIVRAGDLDEALGWARRLAEITTLPIEVRPF